MFDCIACVFSGVANLAVKNIAAFGFRDVLLFFAVFVFFCFYCCRRLLEVHLRHNDDVSF